MWTKKCRGTHLLRSQGSKITEHMSCGWFLNQILPNMYFDCQMLKKLLEKSCVFLCVFVVPVFLFLRLLFVVCSFLLSSHVLLFLFVLSVSYLLFLFFVSVARWSLSFFVFCKNRQAYSASDQQKNINIITIMILKISIYNKIIWFIIIINFLLDILLVLMLLLLYYYSHNCYYYY